MIRTEIINKILILVSILLALVLVISQLRGNNFRQGAENHANNALMGMNFISVEEYNNTNGSAIIIGISDTPADIRISDLYIIEEEELLLNKSEIRAIRKLPPPRILIAKNPAIMARAYILLSQKGIKELYLPEYIKEDMLLKYKFRPDTVNASK